MQEVQKKSQENVESLNYEKMFKAQLRNQGQKLEEENVEISNDRIKILEAWMNLNEIELKAQLENRGQKLKKKKS